MLLPPLHHQPHQLPPREQTECHNYIIQLPLALLLDRPKQHTRRSNTTTRPSLSTVTCFLSSESSSTISSSMARGPCSGTGLEISRSFNHADFNGTWPPLHACSRSMCKHELHCAVFGGFNTSLRAKPVLLMLVMLL
jgi:hypothetical protein